MRSLRSQVHIIQRALGVVNAGLDYMEISVGGGETRMPHKTLQIESIAAGFQYMRGKTMSQSMNCTGLSNPRFRLIQFEQVFYSFFMEMVPYLLLDCKIIKLPPASVAILASQFGAAVKR